MKLTDVSILVVDDESDLRDILVEEMAFRGANVKGVNNGKEAWEELNKTKYDVLLSDVRMPDGDGIDLVKRIATGLTPKPLLLLCTGYADLEMNEAQNLGVVEIISKPFDIDHIAQLITDELALAKKVA